MQPLDRRQLVETHIAWMLTLAEKILNDHSLAQDAVQETFIKAFRAYDTLRDKSKVKPWLKRILVNTSLMQLRQIKRRSEQQIDDYLPDFDDNGCRIEYKSNNLIGTETVVENELLRALIHSAFSKLPDDYRIILLLRDIEGYNTSEVAALLEITPANVKTRLHRARLALKKLLEPNLQGELS